MLRLRNNLQTSLSNDNSGIMELSAKSGAAEKTAITSISSRAHQSGHQRGMHARSMIGNVSRTREPSVFSATD